MRKKGEDEDWGFLEPFDPEAEADREIVLLDDEMPLEALLEVSRPAPQPNLPGVPVGPSEEEKALHNATHCGPAPCCTHCIAGKAREDGHYSQIPRDIELGEKVVEMDYQFYSREGHLVEEESKLATTLTAYCMSTSSRFNIYVRHKGLDEFTVKSFSAWLKRLRRNVVIIKYDSEAPIKAFAEAVQKELGPDRVQLRPTPRYSSQSLGGGEGNNQ